MTTSFGTLRDGRMIHAVPLSAGDLSVKILTLGAILQSVRLTGIDHGLTPTSDRIEDWEERRLVYDGTLVGPVANRISMARTVLGDSELRFEANQEGLHSLHSGTAGIHSKVWDIVGASPTHVVLGLDLPDGEGGFPGNRRLRAQFSVVPPATLRLEVTGTTDATTLLNIANHSNWNLDGTGNWHGHELWIDAAHYLPTDRTCLPTGEIAGVSGTDMDFRHSRVTTKGAPALDHNFCLSDSRVALREVARLTGTSGVSMTLATTEAGLQVYDGRAAATPYKAIALEPQGWPDAPNQPSFPSISLDPGETYNSVSEWRFSRRAALAL